MMTQKNKSRNSQPDHVIAHPAKAALHPRNKHQGRYDFEKLIQLSPDLTRYVLFNQYQVETIDFTRPEAVKALNKALLKSFYGINDWDIPANYLCPPVPGRADYIHYIADLLGQNAQIPTGKSIRILDIGVGANCIYPLIGHCEYGWSFLGSDIDKVALASASRIILANEHLADALEVRWQPSASNIFKGLIKPDELFDATLCNPPFHGSVAEASIGTQRKWKNLDKNQTATQKSTLNFGGLASEISYPGGEAAYIKLMIEESVHYKTQCLWFTTLVSKESNLGGIYRALQSAKVADSKTMDMTQGQKKSRLVAWTFKDHSQQTDWRNKRFNQK